MKSVYTLLFTLLFTNLSFSQVSIDDIIIHYDLSTPVISLINLKTGKIESKNTLKEPPAQVVYLNKSEKVVYVMTKHYLYKIDAIAGQIITEYEYQETLIKKESDHMDPDLMLVPAAFTENGVGLYWNMNESIQLQIKGEEPISTIFKINANNQSKEVYTELNGNEYNPNLIAHEDKLYLQKVNKENNSSLSIVETNLDEFKIIDEITIPINISDNEFGLTNDQIYGVTLNKVNENIFTLLINPKMNTYSNGTCFLYEYNRSEKKMTNLRKINIYGGGANTEVATQFCSFEYVGESKCPEKPEMPIAPVAVAPKKWTKKYREEADRINDEQLSEYRKELDKWSEETLDNSGCEYKLFKMVNGEKVIVKELLGTNSAAVYYDRYVYYYDGLEYLMFDLETDTIIWSLN